MGPLACNRPVYRDGNNLTEILAHRDVDVIEQTKVCGLSMLMTCGLYRCIYPYCNKVCK